MDMQAIGFIGLGAMGAPMARNLLKAGLPLVVRDIDPSKCAALHALGATVAGSPADVARQARNIICMVETTAQLRDVLYGAGGVLEEASPGHNFASMSTIDPLEIARLASDLECRGIGFADAPVSGAVERAVTGELTVLASGNDAAIDAFEPAFNAMGRQIFKLGEAGKGTAAKLVNNLLFHINNVAVAEALTIGRAAGIDPEVLYELIRVSTGNGFAFEIRAPRMLSRDFSPGGKVDISFKDQELETGMAKALGVPAPLAAVSQQIYQMARSLGYGREDGSAVVKVYELLANTPR